MNDTRLYSVSARLREVQQLLDQHEWEGTGTKRTLSYLSKEVETCKEKLMCGVTLEPNF